MSVNQDAPVVAAGEIEVAADPEKVWEVMTDVERWPSWNRNVSLPGRQRGVRDELSVEGEYGHDQFHVRARGASSPAGVR